jgi:meiotic recombination protein DMC1
MAEEPFRLLIMDSITANLRVDFSGRGELAERQQRLGQLMQRLRKVRLFNARLFCGGIPAATAHGTAVWWPVYGDYALELGQMPACLTDRDAEPGG